MDLENWYGEPNDIFLADDGISKWWLAIPLDDVRKTNLKEWFPNAHLFQRNGTYDIQHLEPVTIDGMWDAYCKLVEKYDAKLLELSQMKSKYHKEHGNLMWEELYNHIPELMKLKKYTDNLADRRDHLFDQLIKTLNHKVYGLDNGHYLVHMNIHGMDHLEEKESL